MSFTKEKKTRIQKYLLEQIDNDCPDFKKKTAETFKISETTIRRYIDEFSSSSSIRLSNNSKCGYKLVDNISSFTYNNTKKLEEHIIYYNDIHPLLVGLSDNLQRIWAYSFMEIMNNAIEHSESDSIRCVFRRNALYTEIMIGDFGIGIFNKICLYIKETTGKDIRIMDAVTELFKGKLTTAEGHSGEGIFFTSRILDEFFILSSGAIFSHDNNYDYARDMSETLKESDPDVVLPPKNGTFAWLKMSNSSRKDIKEVFDMFSTVDEGFVKTQIPLKNICEFGYPVSRSQARRLCHRFDKFKEVTLDFEEVSDIGQAFAHEIFIVFQNAHPDIHINFINANDSINSMINHVLKTK